MTSELNIYARIRLFIRDCCSAFQVQRQQEGRDPGHLVQPSDSHRHVLGPACHHVEVRQHEAVERELGDQTGVGDGHVMPAYLTLAAHSGGTYMHTDTHTCRPTFVLHSEWSFVACTSVIVKPFFLLGVIFFLSFLSFSLSQVKADKVQLN